MQRGVKLVPGVKNIIAVACGKGGVGKSTTAVNLALALAAEGATVGVLDADIYGPSQPMMLGIAGRPESKDGKTLEPLEAHGVQAMSIGFLIDTDTPMVWRGPMVTQALEQLLKDTNWRDLDYLIVDLPPGTGDIQLTLSQKVPVTGAVIVTTPQDIALIDARKGLKMFEKVGVPIVGIVENMCDPHLLELRPRRARSSAKAAAKKMCDDYNVPFLGPLPLDIRIREQADSGRPTVVADPDGAIAHDLQRHRAQGRGVRRAEGRGLLGEVPEHRHPEHLTQLPVNQRGDRSRETTSRCVTPSNDLTMSIKSDSWIRRMAAEHGMIEPFEPGQVREVDGRKIVSYGTSSYGYDIRCSNEFKIFTNINSTIVDPKNFDEKSFVDFKGDVCIIPPNSFALARTVEYFRIPRNVLTICLGKIDLRALRHHRQRDAARARMGGLRHARVLEHDAAAREDLRQRRRRAGDLLRVRRGLRDIVQGSRRQVPGPEGRHAAEDLKRRAGRAERAMALASRRKTRRVGHSIIASARSRRWRLVFRPPRSIRRRCSPNSICRISRRRR